MSEAHHLRRQLTLAAAAVATFTAGTATAAAPRLVVFLHLAMKQRALESALSESLPQLEVTAVGRVADLDRVLAQGQDAVMSLPEVLSNRGLSSLVVRGYRAGSATEGYGLVGTDRVPDPATLETVGALDLLGRTGTNDFVKNLLGREPKVMRVTKVEDLLPLLQMQKVDAILLPTRLVSELAATSRLNLQTHPLPKQVGLPAVASVGANGAEVVNAVKALPTSMSRALGIEEWR